ncbi:hypothetical protein [Paenibacillus campinasensis]|uniref:Uncharacterized protein n=1 Tax=Paenibacillus campinasensis TaxID=66347 RepID=A0A268EI83_9BACL|nr:hypothetical protein [Paenibacillus campinasensis]PAD72822.1 hypothetical protein CHH67_21170 [Paenibacillus campinasensis]
MEITPFSIGKQYDTVVNGQIWSFTFDGVDPEDEDLYFITWSTGEEEIHSKEDLLRGIEEVDILRAAGIVYPRGVSDQDQYEALRSVMDQPTYRFGGMVVPRAMVLTCNFAPEHYYLETRARFDSEYMGFEYDPANSLLNITSPDPDAQLPDWVMDRLPVSAVMRINQDSVHKKTIIVVKLQETPS